MELYYGSNNRGRIFVYAPYYFAGMFLNRDNFRFRCDYLFLNRLANSNLSLESLMKKKWKIKRVDVHHSYLDALLDFFYYQPKEKIRDSILGIVELAGEPDLGNSDDSVSGEQYDDGYSEFDSREEYYEDKWWDLGLEPPFLREDRDWSDSYED